MTLVTQIPTLTFPQELDTLEFSEASNETATPISLLVDGSEIYSNNLIAVKGKIALYDLADLFRDWVKKPATVKIMVQGAALATTTMLPCRCDVAQGAEQFCRTHFLSLRGDDGEMAADGRAYFSFYAETAGDVTAQLEVVTANTEGDMMDFSTRTVNKTLKVEQPGIVTFSIDAKDYVPEDSAERLLSLRLKVDERQHNIEIRQPKEDVVYEFHNAFGCLENVSFDSVASNDEVSFQQLHVAGRTRNYQPQTKTKYEAKCMFVPGQAKDLYRDFSTSLEVWSVPGHLPLLVTGCAIKDDSSPFMTCTVKVNLETAERHHRFYPSEHICTFDETFDNTFD